MVEYEGKYLVQSCSIVRFFAKRAGLLGSGEDEEFKIDTIFEGTRDFHNNYFLIHGFNGWNLDKIVHEALPKYLPIFEKVIMKKLKSCLCTLG